MNTSFLFNPSNRSQISSSVQAMMSQILKLQAAGRQILPLHIGQPSSGAPKKALQAAEKAMKQDILGYTDAYGLDALRLKLAKLYQTKYHYDLDPARIIITPGASLAFCMACVGCFDQGANIVICYPVYHGLVEIIKLFGLNIIGLPTRLEDRFMPTIESLEAINQKIDGLLLVNPSNPSGAVMTYEELKELADYCTDRGIRLLADETYHGIYYEQFLKETTALEVSDSVICINSFSKYYSMPGWRIGWMIGPPDVIKNLANVIMNMYICPSTISQYAAIGALDAQDELDKHLVHYAHNRDLLISGLPKAGYDKFFIPQGAFYLYAHVSDMCTNSYQFCLDLLEQQSIASMPGCDFDPINGANYVRFSFAGATEVIQESLSRIKAFKQSCS